jgi:NADP-dependent aldehyde dehydrogenase
MVTTTDPRTGVTTPTQIAETSSTEVAELATHAALATRPLAEMGREGIANLLESIAAAIEEARDELVETAMAETGLPNARLTGELTRSRFQFELFAEAVREGSYLEAAIDHAGDTPLGPQPDVRRMLVSLGPVAVFGASNFPFAFSALGGDVASALAAGCPVIVKAHPSHPLTSERSFEALQAGAERAGAPAGTLAIVHGQDAGVALVTDPNITAVGFTGSLGAAQALRAAIETRPEPIPFYGELSSINPLVITEAAAAARTQEIADGLFASYTGSAGQLCTKPGIAFVPDTAAGAELTRAMVEKTSEAGAGTLLNDRIKTAFGQIGRRLQRAGGQPLAQAPQPEGDAIAVAPVMLETTAGEISSELAEECFGPMILMAKYRTLDEVVAAIGLMPASLTTTVHAEPGDAELVGQLLAGTVARAGRLVYNGYPTGVRVSWAQHHGGPWPATNTLHTSVGVTALRRWLRPLAWQNMPEALLPPELRDDYTGIPRRIDGVLTAA